MPATAQQISNFRADLGSNADEFPDEEVKNLFDRVLSEDYPDGTTNVIYAAAVLRGCDQLIAMYARRTSYQQNQSREDVSDVVKALERMRPKLQAKLDLALDGAGESQPIVRFGRWGGKPPRGREYPHA